EVSLNESNPSAKFDAIVLPSEQSQQARFSSDNESPGGDTARGGSNDQGFSNLSHLVEDGGTLICFDGSCNQLIRRWKLPLKNVLEGLRSSDFYCPGSILRINVDTSNPIARAMSKETDAYFINSSAYDATDAAKIRVIARYAKDGVLQSGWLRGEDKS